MDPIEHLFLLALWADVLFGLFLVAEGVTRLLLWVCTRPRSCARSGQVL